MTDAKTLGQAFDALLQPDKFRDYGPNGLQVEGDRDVQLLVSGVTASRALIEAAIDAQADAIVVHHGLFWRGQDGRVVGWMRERLRLLLSHGIHLFAYHLPLDAHAELGNNAQLAKVLGFQMEARFGEQSLGFVGAPAHTWAKPQALADHVAHALGHPVVCVGGNDKPVRRVAWCTGGAQSYFEAAIAACATIAASTTDTSAAKPRKRLARSSAERTFGRASWMVSMRWPRASCGFTAAVNVSTAAASPATTSR